MKSLRRAATAGIVLALGVSLASCGSDTFEVPEGFFGTVVAEEPRAALLARDVLVEGGSAADAAVTAYFTLAATLPSSAGLTATGSCLVHDPSQKSYQRLDFFPSAGADGAATTALPLAPRAMFSLHARHGIKPLAELIIEAERIARFGAPVSRSLALELAADGAVVTRDPAASRLYAADGRPLVQGAALAQVELAATLSRLRSEGVGTLYSGSLARDFIDGAAAAGVTVDAQRLRETLPVWSPATGVEHDNHIWAVAAPTPADVRLGTAAFGTIVEGADWTDGDDDSRAHLMAEALNAATLLAGGDGALDEDTLSDALARYDEDRRGLSAPLPRLERTLGSRATRRAGATAFFAVDRTGLSVACAIGLGAPFGTGRMIPNLGVFLAPVETESGDGPGAFALMAANINTGQFHMATSGAGGRAALSAVTATALDHWESRIQIEAVPDRPRSHYAGGANVLFVEPSTSAEVVSDLQRRGYTVQPAPSIGTANAFRCVEGLPRREIRCGAAPDQRGAGLMLFEFGG